jgi:hypothetical protein
MSCESPPGSSNTPEEWTTTGEPLDATRPQPFGRGRVRSGVGQSIAVFVTVNCARMKSWIEQW